MIKAVFTFALEGIKGREVYWPGCATKWHGWITKGEAKLTPE